MNYREKLAYLAGIIDGEGTISIWSNQDSKKRGKFNLRIYFSSTDKCIIDWVCENFGGYQYANNAPSRKPNWKQAYIWVLDRPRTDWFLKEIHDFLIIKKERCAIAIKFRETFINFDGKQRKVDDETYQKRVNFVNQMKLLNSRGNP